MTDHTIDLIILVVGGFLIGMVLGAAARASGGRR